MQVVLRPLQEFDLKDVDRVIQAAFRRPVSALQQLQLQLQVEPEGFWVATSADQIVATVGCTDYGQFAYICLMCVLPQYQGQGIGRQMMEHALRWLENRGGRIVLLDATDMGARMYEDMGFVTDSTAIQFERERVVASTADDVSVRAATKDDLTAIAQFDAPLFGANRQKILDALWGQHCERCLIAHDRSGQVTGYLLARDPVLGPWAASRPKVAEALLARGLQFDYQSAPLVFVPRSNQLAIDLMQRSGFVERRRLRHMRLGGDSPPGRPDHLYGQTSLGHG